MKALILAAGLGTRLAPITDSIPKSLVQVNGKPIIFKQIESLMENGISDITVVAGYRADVLIGALGERFGSRVRTVRNNAYAETNNMYSAWLAKDALAGSGFLMMNADVFFDPSVIRSLVDFRAENAIVVDVGRYIEESMKVTQRGGRIAAISKSIPQSEALGCSIDVYKFSPPAGQEFFSECEQYIKERNEVKKWSEVALNGILPRVAFEACPLRGRWLEIDNHEDLAAAEALFSEPEARE